MKNPFLLLILTLSASAFISSAAFATNIYSWTDENGIVHFSDKPTEQGTKIQLPTTHTPSNLTTSTQSEPPSLPHPFVRLLSPLNEETLRQNEGRITIQAITNRELIDGHQLRLKLNGQVQKSTQTQLQWTLDNIDRGEHTLQLQLLDQRKVIAFSKSITVYLHRARIQKKQKS